jgi:predicted GNAT family acetyltransferase
MTARDDVEVRDAPDKGRFEVLADGEVAGFTEYRRHGTTIAFMHTEIDPRMEGRGLGSALIRVALGAAGSEGLAVLPFCPFVKGYIAKHPELVDLVPEARRGEFGL